MWSALPSSFTGLTEREVDERRRQGATNQASAGTGRTFWAIIRANLLSNYNNILFGTGAILAVLGRYNDAFITVVVGFVRAIIGTVQEVRAKRQLEAIAVVASSRVTVLRAGVEQALLPAEIVQDDLICLRSGDQAVVDGRIVDDGAVEMDEALLTGESDLIRKQYGDLILSGSICVTGSARYTADEVGCTRLLIG